MTYICTCASYASTSQHSMMISINGCNWLGVYKMYDVVTVSNTQGTCR